MRATGAALPRQTVAEASGNGGVPVTSGSQSDPCIFLSVPSGHNVSNLLRSAFLPALLEHGVRIVVLSPFAVDPTFGSFVANTMTVVPHGGVTEVSAGCGGQSAVSQLTVNLDGTVITGSNTPANPGQIFGGASPGSDAALAPVIQYPIDQAVAPLNLPPIE